MIMKGLYYIFIIKDYMEVKYSEKVNKRILTVIKKCGILTRNLQFYRIKKMIGNTAFKYEDGNGDEHRVVQYKVPFSEWEVEQLINKLNSDKTSNYRLINFDEYTEICKQGYYVGKDSVYYVNDSRHIGRYDKNGVSYEESDGKKHKVMLVENMYDYIVIDSEPNNVFVLETSNDLEYDKTKHKFQLMVEHGEELPFLLISFHDDGSSISLTLDDVLLLEKELPAAIQSYREYSDSRNSQISKMEKQILEMQKEIARLKG